MMIGRYEVLGELARGGMGAVYRARDPDLKREVAIKLLLESRADSERTRKRFEREVKALAALRHPNIVSVHEVGQHEGRPYLVMDLVKGRTLQERLDREGPLSPRAAAGLIGALAQAVQFAHTRGVLHRDLKPDNVLLAEDQPYVTDFGLARLLDAGQSRLSASGLIMGTPGYFPPEQASGRLDEIGPHSDVYGLGAALYAALTGEAPFKGASLAEVLAATLRRAPTSPARLRPGIDPVLEAICLRCLEKEPTLRFHSAGELAARLGRYLGGADRPPRAKPAVRVAVWAGILVAGGGLLGAAIGVGGPSRRTLEKAEEQARFLDATGLLQRGRARFNDWDLGGAKADFTQALALRPDDPVILVARSRIHIALGNHLPALTDADRAVDLAPDFGQGYLLRGLARTVSNDPGAKADFLRALECDSSLAEAHVGLAELAYSQGQDMATAWSRVEQALALRPDLAPGLFMKAQLLSIEGDHAAGLEIFTGCLARAPKDRTGWLGRANIFSRMGDPESARRDLQQALRLTEPGSVYDGLIRTMIRQLLPTLSARELEALRARATQRAHEKDYSGAISDVNRILGQVPGDIHSLVIRAGLRMRLGFGREAAVEDFTRVLEIDPSHVDALNGRGALRIQGGDLEGGVEDIRRGLALLTPDDPRVRVMRPILDEAVEDLEAERAFREKR